MKEYRYLYQKMLDEKNIRKAYKHLRKGKTKRDEIKYIDGHLDEEVVKMREMIKNTRPGEVEDPGLAYQPCRRTPKYIREHKKARKIYMPEIHEQWLHHIIVLVLGPIVMSTIYPYSCGSIPKRGAHYGKKQMEKWIRENKGIRYFAKIDIRHFYDNIRLDILMRELSIQIKDDWFLYIIRTCLQGFEKGIPLGFYISQWLANYFLAPLDMLILKQLGMKKYMRYMDDMVIFSENKKTLHRAVADIRQMLGRRFRLRLKHNYQVCKFDFVKKNGNRIGRPVDFMGFVFFRDRTVIRKNIMLAAVRLASKMDKQKTARRGYYGRHIRAMLSYMGWFMHCSAYACYTQYIKPHVDIGRLKKIISKIDRREDHDTMERRTLSAQTG